MIRFLYRCKQHVVLRLRKFLCDLILSHLFINYGKNVHIGRLCTFYYANISIGNNVYIGDYNYYLSSIAKIIIKDHVVFGPHVSIVTGDHRFDDPNRLIDEYTSSDKRKCDDQDVVFEGDNWIGMNVTILKGVHIGKGAIIGAGSVVTKDCDENSIYVGNPARKIAARYLSK